jgi:hypothetical protein
MPNILEQAGTNAEDAVDHKLELKLDEDKSNEHTICKYKVGEHNLKEPVSDIFNRDLKNGTRLLMSFIRCVLMLAGEQVWRRSQNQPREGWKTRKVGGCLDRTSLLTTLVICHLVHDVRRCHGVTDRSLGTTLCSFSCVLFVILIHKLYYSWGERGAAGVCKGSP